jgi:hypothetical protein
LTTFATQCYGSRILFLGHKDLTTAPGAALTELGFGRILEIPPRTAGGLKARPYGMDAMFAAFY